MMANAPVLSVALASSLFANVAWGWETKDYFARLKPEAAAALRVESEQVCQRLQKTDFSKLPPIASHRKHRDLTVKTVREFPLSFLRSHCVEDISEEGKTVSVNLAELGTVDGKKIYSQLCGSPPPEGATEEDYDPALEAGGSTLAVLEGIDGKKAKLLFLTKTEDGSPAASADLSPVGGKSVLTISSEAFGEKFVRKHGHWEFFNDQAWEDQLLASAGARRGIDPIETDVAGGTLKLGRENPWMVGTHWPFIAFEEVSVQLTVRDDKAQVAKATCKSVVPPRDPDGIDPKRVAKLVAAGALSDSSLVEAAKSTDLAKARSAIAAGEDPNATDVFGIPPLSWASATTLRDSKEPSKLELVAFLLDHGADPNAAGEDVPGHAFRTPLGVAKGKLARLLLAKGATGEGEAVQSAVESNDLELVKLMLARGLDPNAGCTPLASARSPEMMLALLQGGADPNIHFQTEGNWKDCNRDSSFNILESAVRQNDSTNLAVIKEILDRGVDVNLDLSVGHPDKFRVPTTALSLARQLGKTAIAEALQARGAIAPGSPWKNQQVAEYAPVSALYPAYDPITRKLGPGTSCPDKPDMLKEVITSAAAGEHLLLLRVSRCGKPAGIQLAALGKNGELQANSEVLSENPFHSPGASFWTGTFKLNEKEKTIALRLTSKTQETLALFRIQGKRILPVFDEEVVFDVHGLLARSGFSVDEKSVSQGFHDLVRTIRYDSMAYAKLNDEPLREVFRWNGKAYEKQAPEIPR